jgi:hypothetical protein
MNSFDYKSTVLPASNAESHDSTDREPHNTRLTSLQLKAVLEVTNPFCSADEQDEILKALHHETAGSADGLALADDWCSRGNSHPGTEALTSKWHSFDGCADDQVTIDTIRSRVEAHGFDWDETCRQAEKDSSPSENPLDKFSLKGKRDQLLRDAVEQEFALEPLALMGQATAIFGASNTGKSLTILHLTAYAASLGIIDLTKLYYFNADDSYAGVLEKLEHADEFGYHMIVEGHQGFSADQLPIILDDLIANRQAKGIIIVLDTGKKFVDPMSKREGRKFGKHARRFVLHGGTIIVLAHTNKHMDSEGKPIYAGTTDIVEDFDCAYLLYEVSADVDTATKMVQFENIKNRGKVARQASFRYSIAEGLSYREILDSVERIGQDEVASMKQAAELESDALVIEAITHFISEGIDTKMALADAAAKRSGVSKRTALRVLEKYCGDNPDLHRWNFQVYERGAKRYHPLNPITAGNDPAV